MTYPRYRCHKIVEAFKIVGISPAYGNAGVCLIVDLRGEGGTSITVPQQWLARHNAEIGGYWVRYEDGYESYSPAGAFEKGYTLIADEAQPAAEVAGVAGGVTERERFLADVAISIVRSHSGYANDQLFVSARRYLTWLLPASGEDDVRVEKERLMGANEDLAAQLKDTLGEIARLQAQLGLPLAVKAIPDDRPSGAETVITVSLLSERLDTMPENGTL
jgi:hypothetical protein